MSAVNYPEKLAAIQKAERAGLIVDVAISAFKSTCPFCFVKGSFSIFLHSRNYAIGYSCACCGETGDFGQLKDNLILAKGPKSITIRRDRKTEVKQLEGRNE